jgi:6-pyruvoyltetrahydropterin/6-carboxytetrahydropterin synthase
MEEVPAFYELSQKFFFEAAHTLDRELDAEGSRRIHGHTYQAQVTVRGMPHAHSAMILDLGDLNAHINRVRNQLDHHFLDDVPGLGPATLESLCAFIYRELLAMVPHVVRVRVERSATGDRCELVSAACIPTPLK